MKKLKFIPVLLLVASLAACAEVRVTVKEPRFEKKGKEITQEEFRSQLAETMSKNEFFKEKLDLSPTLLKDRRTLKYTQKRALSKTYASSEIAISSDTVTQYDTINSVIKSECVRKETSEIKDLEGETKSSGLYTYNDYYQKGKDDYAQNILAISQDYKTYSIAATVAEGETHKQKMDAIFASGFVSVVSYTHIVDYAEFADTTSYHFYRNKDMFTLTFKTSKNGVVMDTIDSVQTEIYRYEKAREVKIQVNFADGKETAKLSDEEKIVYRVFENWNDYKKDEIIETETYDYLECSAVGKDSRIKPIEDLSSYRLI